MPRAKETSWYRSSPIQTSPADFGCGLRQITCESRLRPRWSARKIWLPLVPKGRSNEVWESGGRGVGGLLAGEGPSEGDSVVEREFATVFSFAPVSSANGNFHRSLWIPYRGPRHHSSNRRYVNCHSRIRLSEPDVED